MPKQHRLKVKLYWITIRLWFLDMPIIDISGLHFLNQYQNLLKPKSTTVYTGSYKETIKIQTRREKKHND